MPRPQDAKQLGEHLHQQLLSGVSLTATSQIAEAFLSPLLRLLRRKFKNVKDQALIDDAVEDALQNYFAQPEQFDPARASLATYLHLRAKTYLLNKIGREKTLQDQFVVEVDASETVYTVETQDDVSVEEWLIEHETESGITEQLQRIISDPVDFEIVMLMIEGVRETSVYAQVLNITGLTSEEQTQTVKRHKDRLKKLVQRKYKVR